MTAPGQTHTLTFRNQDVPATNYITFDLEPSNATPIGIGGFGIVHIMRRTDTSTLVAVKRMRYSENPAMNAEMDRALEKDITPLLLCKNEHILEYLGLTQEEHPGIVSQYAENGSLASYLKTTPAADRIKILREVAQGIAYLHQPSPEIIYDGKKISIVHGDLHPGNVLIMGDGRAVLADFGLCKISEDGGLVSRTNRAAGDLPDGLVAYLAPEMYPPIRGITPEVTQQPEYDRRRTVKADVFAYGTLVFTTLGGNLKRALGPMSASVTISIIQGTRPRRTDVPIDVGDTVWNIVEECWRGDASTRPTMDEVLAQI